MERASTEVRGVASTAVGGVRVDSVCRTFLLYRTDIVWSRVSIGQILKVQGYTCTTPPVVSL